VFLRLLALIFPAVDVFEWMEGMKEQRPTEQQKIACVVATDVLDTGTPVYKLVGGCNCLYPIIRHLGPNVYLPMDIGFSWLNRKENSSLREIKRVCEKFIKLSVFKFQFFSNLQHGIHQCFFNSFFQRM